MAGGAIERGGVWLRRRHSAASGEQSCRERDLRPSSKREWRKKKNEENENERNSIEGGAA